MKNTWEIGSSYEHTLEIEQDPLATLYLRRVGCAQRLPGEGWGLALTGGYRLYHVIAGSGAVFFSSSGRQYRLTVGDTILIYPDTSAEGRADARQPWEYIWIEFNGLGAAGIVGRTAFTENDPVLYGGESSREIRVRMSAVYNSCGPAAWEELEAMARLYRLFGCLTWFAPHDDRGGETDIGDSAEKAAAYISAHYREPVSMEALAVMVGVSHASLYRRFMKQYGMSPKRFLMRYRIEQACGLLLSTDMSVQEVAHAVGFDDAYYFSRVFKEIKGSSPTQFTAHRKKTGSP